MTWRTAGAARGVGIVGGQVHDAGTAHGVESGVEIAVLLGFAQTLGHALGELAQLAQVHERTEGEVRGGAISHDTPVQRSRKMLSTSSACCTLSRKRPRSTVWVSGKTFGGEGYNPSHDRP
jgi:hypothetical protein